MNKLIQKTFVQFLAYTLAIVVIIVLILVPSVKGIKVNRVNLAETKVKLNNLTLKLDTLKKLSESDSDISQRTTIVSKYLPNTLDSSSFIVETEGLAKALNIVISSFSISSATSSGSSSNQQQVQSTNSQPQSQFNITANCSFSQALSLIEQLEKLSRFNTLSSVMVSSVASDQVAIQLTGQIYYGNP